MLKMQCLNVVGSITKCLLSRDTHLRGVQIHYLKEENTGIQFTREIEKNGKIIVPDCLVNTHRTTLQLIKLQLYEL